METSGHCWGPSHELGHVHQGAINMIACTEASNNLFSNISVFNLGKFVTWGDGVDTMADYYEDKVAWTLQGIGIKMRMYFQLYLYYHVIIAMLIYLVFAFQFLCFVQYFRIIKFFKIK